MIRFTSDGQYFCFILYFMFLARISKIYRVGFFSTWSHCIPKDTKMFLESSLKPRKSKIVAAAIEVEDDYKKYGAKLQL